MDSSVFLHEFSYFSGGTGYDNFFQTLFSPVGEQYVTESQLEGRGQPRTRRDI
jgi:hypothetical protein